MHNQGLLIGKPSREDEQPSLRRVAIQIRARRHLPENAPVSIHRLGDDPQHLRQPRKCGLAQSRADQSRDVLGDRIVFYDRLIHTAIISRPPSLRNQSFDWDEAEIGGLGGCV